MPIISQTMNFRFLPQEISVWLTAVLKSNIQERKATPLPQEDLLQWLLNGMENEKMDEKEAISHAFSFFIEGFETSSGVMSLALYSLANNPDIQQTLRVEVQEVLERHGNEFSFEALQEMTYLDGVVMGEKIKVMSLSYPLLILTIKETMRLYPPGLMMAKRCTKAYEMPLLPGQSTPFLCPPGMTVMIPVYAIHM